MSVRERIAEYHASIPAAEVETPVVETEHVEVAPVASESVSNPVEEDNEPDENSFDNPSDYRKAVREYDRKLVAKQLKEEHEKVVDGLYKDLRRQRAGKRELKSELEQIKNQISGFAKTNIAEPKFTGDIDKYANEVASYQIAKEKESAEKLRQERIQKEDNEKLVNFDQNAKRNAALKDLPDLDKVIERVKDERIGDGIADKAVSEINKSSMTWHIYHFLGSNPDVTDKIEDLSPTDQVIAIKQLEAKLKENGYRVAPKVDKPIVKSPDPQAAKEDDEKAISVVKPVVKPSIKGPIKAPKGGADTGHKPITGNMDLHTYIARRKQLKQSGQW